MDEIPQRIPDNVDLKVHPEVLSPNFNPEGEDMSLPADIEEQLAEVQKEEQENPQKIEMLRREVDSRLSGSPEATTDNGYDVELVGGAASGNELDLLYGGLDEKGKGAVDFVRGKAQEFLEKDDLDGLKELLKSSPEWKEGIPDKTARKEAAQLLSAEIKQQFIEKRAQEAQADPAEALLGPANSEDLIQRSPVRERYRKWYKADQPDREKLESYYEENLQDAFPEVGDDVKRRIWKQLAHEKPQENINYLKGRFEEEVEDLARDPQNMLGSIVRRWKEVDQNTDELKEEYTKGRLRKQEEKKALIEQQQKTAIEQRKQALEDADLDLVRASEDQKRRREQQEKQNQEFRNRQAEQQYVEAKMRAKQGEKKWYEVWK